MVRAAGESGVKVGVRHASLAEIFALRHAELRPGRPVASAEFEGDHDPATRHLAAFLVEGGTVVGCASLMRQAWRGKRAYQLRGMATRADLVRRGIGSAVLRFAEHCARDDGVGVLWCQARLSAVAFYAAFGWQTVSDVFDVPTVGPHRTMLRRLTPPAD
jgi:GNAT superfamily N-acetyltransferase